MLSKHLPKYRWMLLGECILETSEKSYRFTRGRGENAVGQDTIANKSSLVMKKNLGKTALFESKYESRS